MLEDMVLGKLFESKLQAVREAEESFIRGNSPLLFLSQYYYGNSITDDMVWPYGTRWREEK